jgi:V8-like Glu-specific endopeptidase
MVEGKASGRRAAVATDRISSGSMQILRIRPAPAILARRFAALLVAALLAALCISSLTAQASARAHGVKGSVDTATHKRLHASRDKAGDGSSFWTPRRMRRAKPLAVQVSGNAPISHPRQQAPKRGTPLEVPATQPAPSSPASAQGALGFVSHRVDDPTVYPYSTHGRIFIQLAGGLATCSGTALSSQNRSVVFTAGHCVNSGGPRGHWYGRKWTFVPAYHDGVQPYGSFRAKEIWSTPGWIASSNFNYDIGAAVVSRNGAGQKLDNAAGARGIATGQSRDQEFSAFGYPADLPFDGQSLWECDSPYGGDDPSSDPGPPPMRIGCDMTAGSSGGGWVIDGQFLNSVVSYGYDGDPIDLFGPYFGQAARNLFNRVRRR